METPNLPTANNPSDQSDDQSANFAHDHNNHHCPGRRRRGFVAGLLLGIVGAGLLGFAIGAATPAAEAAFGAMSRRGGDNGGDHDGPPTPAEAKDHAEFFIAFALHRLDATPDQQDRVQKVVDGAIDELFPVVEKHRANREALRAILGAKTIDRAAIERLRVEELALADNLSRIVATAVGDSAEVLSAEQRTDLLDRLESFRHHP